MAITFDIINGMCLGLEHISGDEEEGEVAYIIGISLLIFRVCLIKFKEQAKESPLGLLLGGFFTSVHFNSETEPFQTYGGW